MKTVVSIITPCYNSEHFISSTIQSVLDQSYEYWEMLIVDDNSSDNSVSIVDEYMLIDPRIKCIQLAENRGAAVCRNKAIEMAKGDYIAFLDSDDLWSKNKLEIQIQFMSSNNYKLTFGRYLKIDEKGQVIKNSVVKTRSKLSYREMLTSNKMGCLTVVYNAKELGKIYMPLIRKRQDYALWLKILSITPYAYGMKDILGSYRVRKSSISSSKIEMMKWNWKLFREIEKRSFFGALYSLSMNIINKLFNW